MNNHNFLTIASLTKVIQNFNFYLNIFLFYPSFYIEFKNSMFLILFSLQIKFIIYFLSYDLPSQQHHELQRRHSIK